MNMFIVTVLFVAFIEKFIAGMDHANRKIVPKANFSLELMKELLRTGDRADVHFLVGDKQKLVKAHKAILEKASKVFEAMFRFNEANEKAAAAAAGTGSSKTIKPVKVPEVKVPEVKVPEVKVPDVEVEAFKVMLSFIYATDLSGLNGDNAMSVLYAANIFHLPKLVDSCLNFPIPELNSVFFALDQARFLREEDFARRCLEHIDENAGALIFSEAFLQIDQESLCEILDRDELMINEEIAIWNAALRWADEKCRQNGIECSAKNRRAMLGPALYKIRFPLIPQKDFTENIVPSGVLEKDEQAGVYQYYSHPDAGLPELDQLKFPTNRRADAGLTLQNRWDSAASHEKLALSEPAGLTVQHNGKRGEWHSVFAERPIPKGKSGTFYYEVTISGKRMSAFTIGLATKQMPLDNRVGENKGTYAYASWGIVLVEGANAPTYETDEEIEAFGDGDVIGCGVNLANRQIFYTKNGHRLGENETHFFLEPADLLVDFGAVLFPCISLHTPGTKIEANFGPEFKFNIPAEGI